MKRKLFSVASLLSLLLWLVTVVMWVLSYRGAYAIGGTTPGAVYSWTASRGRMVTALASLKGGGFTFYHSVSSPFEIRAYGLRGKFGFFVETQSLPGRFRFAMVYPIAVQAVATAILPGIWMVVRQRSGLGVGRCGKCDYDLTGNTSGVCPECGAGSIGGNR